MLLVEDDNADAELVLAALVAGGIELDVNRATNKQQFRTALAGPGVFDAVLCDYHLPDLDALEALALAFAAGVGAPLIVVSGGLSDEKAAECMRLGAADYIHKDRLARLPHALTRAVEQARRVAASRELRERVETELAQSEEVFRGLFEQSSVGICLHDVPRAGDRGSVRWNDRVKEMLGVVGEPDDASWTAVLQGDAADDALEQYSRLFIGDTPEITDRRMLTRPDGTTLWVDLSTVLVRDQDDEPLRFQTMVLDVTDQVLAFAALRQSELETERRAVARATQLSLLLELAQTGLAGHDTGHFLAQAADLVACGTETVFATILELTDDHFVRVAAHGLRSGVPPDAVSAGPVALDSLTSEFQVSVTDFEAHPELVRSPWMLDSNIVTTVTAPIRGPVRPFGLLCVHSSAARTWSADDLEFMQLASTVISVAIERKREEQMRKLLLGRLVTAQEVERKAIAGDIHDDAVQVMTAANMRLELFRMGLTDPRQIEAADKLQDTISLATARLRALLFDLSPPDLETRGLAVALRRHLEQFAADADLRWEFSADLDSEPSQQLQILLFRVVQEALVNVRKHARATTVSVALKSEAGGVMIRLADNGRGFDQSAAEPQDGHLGLASMRERAEIGGGWCRLTSEPGHGTEVLTWVPTARSDVTRAAPAA